MTTTGQPQIAFPTLQALGAQTAVALLADAAAWVIFPVLFSRSGAVSHAVLFATALVWLASVLGLVPVVLLSPRGVMPTICGYFIGMGVRLVLCFAAANIAVHAFGLAGPPVALCLSGLYMLLLLVEIAFVGRYLWRADRVQNAATGGVSGRPDSGASDSREILA